MRSNWKRATLAAAVMAAAGVSGAANADNYLVSSNGEVVVNNYGECWHTGSWKPGDEIVGCDGKVAEVVAVPVAVEPPPPPAPVYKVEKVERITLDAETYFNFDKATLKPGAVDKLDALVERIKNAEGVNKLTITGHADRIGPEAYNQKLSERRAESVRDYLAQRLDSASMANVETMGKGESEPLQQCPDMRGNKLIACLAPNRRVDVDAELKVRAE